MAERDEVLINYAIPGDLHYQMKQLAAWKGQTLRVWITRALAAEAERQEQERAEQERKRRSR